MVNDLPARICMIRLVILGEPASKANSRQLVTIKDRPAFIKSKKARDYERDALKQIPPLARQMLTGPVKVTLRIFYATERPDLDESVVLDVLQARHSGKGDDRVLVQRGVYLNDRQVREKHVFHAIDRINPRAEIEVEALQAQQVGMFHVEHGDAQTRAKALSSVKAPRDFVMPSGEKVPF